MTFKEKLYNTVVFCKTQRDLRELQEILNKIELVEEDKKIKLIPTEYLKNLIQEHKDTIAKLEKEIYSNPIYVYRDWFDNIVHIGLDDTYDNGDFKIETQYPNLVKHVRVFVMEKGQDEFIGLTNTYDIPLKMLEVPRQFITKDKIQIIFNKEMDNNYDLLVDKCEKYFNNEISENDFFNFLRDLGV